MSDTGILLSLEDEEAFRSRVVLDYTSRDFTAIRSQLIGLARGLMPEWQTAGEASDFGTLLVELFAYMGDVLNFYIDRTASEAFLGTAVRRQSVLYIADMLGYTPMGQAAASVELEFTLDPNAEAAVTLPVGTTVYNETNDSSQLIVFQTDTEVSLDPLAVPPVLTGNAFATEGLMVRDELLGVSKGIPNNEFIIPNKGVVFNTVSIQTNEGGQTLPWSFITDISLARPTQPAFTTFLDDSEYTHVLFGDNASGRIPPVNAELYVTYRYGVGAEANDLAPDAINSIAATSVGGADLWGVTVRNPESPLGGTDPESVDAMRQSIPRAAVRIKSRAVTLNDYADLALQVPGVAKSVAHGTVYTAVHVRIAPQDGQANDTYMQELLDSVEYYMADKVMVGSTVYAEPTIAQGGVDALWEDVYIRVTAHVTPGFNRASVRSQVDAVIRAGLAFNAVDFGFRVTIGKIYRMALAIQGVEWAEVTWLATIAPSDDPDDNTTPETGELTVGAAIYQHDPSNTMADPGARHYRRNNNAAPTLLALSVTDDDNKNVLAGLVQLKVGDHIVYRPITDINSWYSYIITGPVVNNTTWFQIPVAVADSGPTAVVPGVNAKVLFSFIRYVPTPYTQGNVIDIDTDPLLIPRIEPTEVIAEETDWPDMSEEERTHDGLWVIAVGGTPGT